MGVGEEHISVKGLQDFLFFIFGIKSNIYILLLYRDYSVQFKIEQH